MRKIVLITAVISIYVFTYISFFWFIPKFLNNLFGLYKNEGIFLFQVSCAIGLLLGHYIAGWICNLIFNKKKPFKLYLKR